MAKTIKKEDINEKEIIASFLQDEPVDYASLVNERRENIENAPIPPADPPKEESRRRKGKELDYETLFVKGSPITARSGKMVYIRRNFHDNILSVCRVIGNNEVSISGYIDNVLAHHFKTYENEINRLYDEKHKGITLHKDE